MPGKAAKGAAKADAKKKEKVVEDKTFGLKNKNRSKAVQKYVQTVQQSAKAGSKEQRQQDMEREKKKQEKMEKKMKEEEMRKLYGGVDGQKGKKKDEDESAAAAAAAERGEYLWTADDFDEVEADDTRLEEQLEAEREALVGRTDLTPVNEDSFQAWWKAKKQAEFAATEKQRKAQIKKFKQTGRGISGRALFEHDATIFVDDADAAEEVEREASEDEDEGGEKKGEAKAVDEALFDGEDLPDDEEDEA